MSKKKRPNQKTAVVKPDPLLQPVLGKDIFATFLATAQSIGNEVVARRAFQDELGAYLAEKSLVDDFNAWRERRAQPAAVPAND